MTQGELFGPDMPPAAAPAAAGLSPEPVEKGSISPRRRERRTEALRSHLQQHLGLWVDPCTADYLLRAIDRGQETIEFIAADVRSGRSRFHVIPAVKLRSA